jgi:hypothetical protein
MIGSIMLVIGGLPIELLAYLCRFLALLGGRSA